MLRSFTMRGKGGGGVRAVVCTSAAACPAH